MECKLSLNEVLSKLNSWESTKDGREAVVKEFKFTDWMTGETIKETFEEGTPFADTLIGDGGDVSHKVRAKAGTLSLFPSNTFHQVKPSKDFNDRYSLIVNTFPAGKMGHYRFFNGIEFEIK